MKKRLREIGSWVVDNAHLLNNFTVMYLRRTPPKHYLGYVKEGKVPIILLPGIFGRWAFLKPLADYISLLGHPVYVVPKLGNNLVDIPTSAQLVREVIAENNLTHAIIVAHSKGGLVAKYLLAHENADHRTDGLVAVATPFSGSRLGNYFSYYPAQELATDSAIILYLQSHTQVNAHIISIIPQYDNYVWHEQTSFLAGAKDNIYVPNHGHSQLLRDRHVWTIIADAIHRLTQTQ